MMYIAKDIVALAIAALIVETWMLVAWAVKNRRQQACKAKKSPVPTEEYREKFSAVFSMTDLGTGGAKKASKAAKKAPTAA